MSLGRGPHRCLCGCVAVKMFTGSPAVFMGHSGIPRRNGDLRVTGARLLPARSLLEQGPCLLHLSRARGLVTRGGSPQGAVASEQSVVCPWGGCSTPCHRGSGTEPTARRWGGEGCRVPWGWHLYPGGGLEMWPRVCVCVLHVLSGSGHGEQVWKHHRV